MTRGLAIREFDDSDYEDIARLEETVYPDRKMSVESLRFGDEKKADKCKHQRYIAELDGKVIGHGFYTQWEGSYRPGKFFVYGLIHPDHQGKGYGSRFYQYILKELERHDPVKIECHAREDKERGLRFLQYRGFEETMTMWGAELDVKGFDFHEYDGLEERLDEEGIVIISLSELEYSEDNKRKLYQLHEDIMEDVPMTDEYTNMDYDRYIERVFENPNFFPEGFILAVKDDEFVGMSSHVKKEKEDALFTYLTGVRRGVRNKGIATAMKVKAIKKAKEKGISKIKTMNETGNEGILHLNDELGFEKKPGWVDFEKEL